MHRVRVKACALFRVERALSMLADGRKRERESERASERATGKRFTLAFHMRTHGRRKEIERAHNLFDASESAGGSVWA